MDIQLDRIRISDWRDLCVIAIHPSFFYRALNARRAWIKWRAARYILKSQIAWILRRRVRAIRETSTQKLIGSVVFIDLHKRFHGCAEIGYFIAAPFQHEGIGTASVFRFVDWGIETLGITELDATANPENAPSIKLLERLGFSVVGEISTDQNKYVDRFGRPEPRVIMRGNSLSITKSLDVARSKGLYSRSIPLR